MVEVVKGDLLRQAGKWTIAHCVGADGRMGAGVAVPIKKKYDLWDFGKLNYNYRIPGTAVWYQQVFNLVTKDDSSDRPNPGQDDIYMKRLEDALIDMKLKATRYGIDYIAMPKIASGLDRQDWTAVLNLIKKVFDEHYITIRIVEWEK